MCPNEPVNGTSYKDGDADQAVQIVWQAFVNALTVTGRDERRDHQVDIAQKEHESYRPRCPEGWRPAILLWFVVKIKKASCDEDVDNGKWVRNDTAKVRYVNC